MTWLTAMGYLCHKWPQICFTCRKHFTVLSIFMTYHRLNTTGATSGAGTVYLYEAHKVTLVFSGVCVTRSLVVYVCFVDIFVLLYLFFWPLCFLFFFDLRICITPLVSFNLSSKLFDSSQNHYKTFQLFSWRLHIIVVVGWKVLWAGGLITTWWRKDDGKN
jgi:hypothetical protein